MNKQQPFVYDEIGELNRRGSQTPKPNPPKETPMDLDKLTTEITAHMAGQIGSLVGELVNEKFAELGRPQAGPVISKPPTDDDVVREIADILHRAYPRREGVEAYVWRARVWHYYSELTRRVEDLLRDYERRAWRDHEAAEAELESREA